MNAPIPVCVFAKPPLAGAKTRLSRKYGASAAARLARAFFADVFATVRALPWARPVLATTTRDAGAFELDDPPEIWMQGEGDLGERMERVLARGVAEAGRAIVIGADLPGLPSAHLDSAREALATREAVLGPTVDGGFYLIGLSRVPAGALAHLPWSHYDTLAKTAARLAELGLDAARAPIWFDVDEPEDLPRVRRVLERNPERAPHTMEALLAMGA